MGISADIDFSLHEDTGQFTNFDIVKLLYNNHWTFNDTGLKTYVPLDCEIGDFNRENIKDEEVFKILAIKQKSNENLSVVMTWKESNIGFILSFHEHLNFSLVLNINRRVTPYQVTDFNWYLERLVPCLLESNLQIINLRCSQIH